jgi:hypothetical protein
MEVGQRVRIGKIRRGKNCPADLVAAYEACEGRILKIKTKERWREDKAPGVPLILYEFYIGHLTGKHSNRNSYMESLYLEEDEIEPLKRKPKPGDRVILTSIPPGLLTDLPEEDQEAIRAIVGQPVTLQGYDAEWKTGEAILEFTDANGDGHTIWVKPDFIKPYHQNIDA